MTDPYAPPASAGGAPFSPDAAGKIEVTYTDGLLDIAFDQIGLYWRDPIIPAKPARE